MRDTKNKGPRALPWKATREPSERTTDAKSNTPYLKVEEDTYTPPEAARILRLSRRRVTQMLGAGELEGTQDPGTGRWKIPQRAVHERLKDRPARGRPDKDQDRATEGSEEAADLRDRVEDLSRELGRLEGRLELTEVAESTLREQLERERDRADRLEEELREARERLLPWWRRQFGNRTGT